MKLVRILNIDILSNKKSALLERLDAGVLSRLTGHKITESIPGSTFCCPRWAQMLGMEWFWRFCHEPRRLFRRYFVDDPKFFWYFLKQLLGIYKNPFGVIEH